MIILVLTLALVAIGSSAFTYVLVVPPPRDGVPAFGTEEYRWWCAGAKAEATIHREGLTREQREIISFITDDAKYHPELTPLTLLSRAQRVYSAVQQTNP